MTAQGGEQRVQQGKLEGPWYTKWLETNVTPEDDVVAQELLKRTGMCTMTSSVKAHTPMLAAMQRRSLHSFAHNLLCSCAAYKFRAFNFCTHFCAPNAVPIDLCHPSLLRTGGPPLEEPRAASLPAETLSADAENPPPSLAHADQPMNKAEPLPLASDVPVPPAPEPEPPAPRPPVEEVVLETQSLPHIPEQAPLPVSDQPNSAPAESETAAPTVSMWS